MSRIRSTTQVDRAGRAAEHRETRESSMKIKAPRMTLLPFAVVLLLGTEAEAQKVKMPKEGTFEWEFSLAAPADMPVATKELTLMHYVSRGNIKAIPEG